jgi:glutathione S-transferase
MSRRVLYTVGDSPPGRAVQMCMAYLDLTYEVQEVDFDNGELSFEFWNTN